jgi:hypothetical protein
MPKPNRLAGHALRNEGRIYAGPIAGYVAGIVGPAICSCGAKSETFAQAADRKRWHRQHKADIRQREVEARP